MIDVHLIGYTADLEHLVLDLDGESNGRYRLVVDADLLATIAEIRTRCAETGKEWPGDDLVEWDEDEWADETEDWDDEDEDDESAEVDAELDEDDESESEDELAVDLEVEEEPAAAVPDEPDDEPAPAAPVARERPARAAAPSPRPAEPTPPAPAAKPDPKLSPAQIQTMLRSGRTPQSVAKAAGTDVAWIERWLPPILEERARVLREARALKLKRPRLGTSRAALGDAVTRALAERNVDPADVTWETSRRNDGRWRVSVKYRHRNKARTASWTYDPRAGEIEPSSDLAKDLGFRGPKRAASAKKRTGAKTSAPKGPGSKAPKKTPTAKPSGNAKASDAKGASASGASSPETVVRVADEPASADAG